MQRMIRNEITSSRDSRRYLLLALFVVLFILSCRLLISTVIHHSFWSSYPPLLYQAGTLGFNYFQFGFVRRGLGGSIAYLLGPNLLYATALFHVLSAMCVAALACWLLGRIAAPLPVLVPFAVVMADLMLFWAEDAGRTDMAVAALLASATIAVIHARLALACLCLVVGLEIHETEIIFGLPLLAALYLERRRLRTISVRDAAGAAAVLLSGLLLYVSLDRLPHAGTGTMVATIRSELPRNVQVDWALYFALSGMRGVRNSLCQNAIDPNHVLHALGACVLVLLVTAALAGLRLSTWVRALLASVPPFLFLWIVANDMSRWATLSLVNVWLVCACRRIDEGMDMDRFVWARIAFAVLLLPLHYPYAVWVNYPIYIPSPFIENIARKLGGPPTPNVEDAFRRCDSSWRTVLGDRVKPGTVRN